MQCIGGLESYGRKRRSLRHKALKTANATSIDIERSTEEQSDRKRNNQRFQSVPVLYILF